MYMSLESCSATVSSFLQSFLKKWVSLTRTGMVMLSCVRITVHRDGADIN